MDIFNICQKSVDWLANIWIQVHRVNDFYIGKFFSCIDQRLANFFKAIAKAFTPMTCDEYYPLAFANERKLLMEFVLQV
ncbi:hypothetical protein D3C76_1709540 [compost metagenome]